MCNVYWCWVCHSSSYINNKTFLFLCYCSYSLSLLWIENCVYDAVYCILHAVVWPVRVSGWSYVWWEAGAVSRKEGGGETESGDSPSPSPHWDATVTSQGHTTVRQSLALLLTWYRENTTGTLQGRNSWFDHAVYQSQSAFPRKTTLCMWAYNMGRNGYLRHFIFSYFSFYFQSFLLPLHYFFHSHPNEICNSLWIHYETKPDVCNYACLLICVLSKYAWLADQDGRPSFNTAEQQYPTVFFPAFIAEDEK